MKKIVSVILSLALFGTVSSAYSFPEPDWGALLSERKSMETTSDFELYVEGNPESAPYYGAKLEPRSGVYLGMIGEQSEPFQPLGSCLTYMEADSRQSEPYYPPSASDDVVTMVGWNTSSIDNVDYDYIRAALDNLSKYNKPMFIRFANEMNCSNLGDNPDLYIQVFRNVANMIHEYPNFAIVWSPNDMGALDRPFQYFYPGDEYVDWIGVSCYMTKYFTNEQNTKLVDSQYFMTGDYAWATNKIKPLIKFMEDYNINKPVMISEGGVARYNSFGDDYTGWHEPRLRNMLWNVIMKYPQIKMINYFNNPFNNYGEHYYITDYPSSVSIFKEAASNGAYLRSASDTPEFAFSRANDGDTLIADNDIVKLYTLAYFANKPDISVNYRIDGQWFHSANQIPYTCNFDINSISDGVHKLSIDANGTSKEYTLYKRGQYVSFGKEPDTSLVAPSPIPQTREITVTVNGQKLSFDQPPVIVDDRTLVPLRAIFETLGATVEWEQSTQTVTSKRSNTTISLTIGDNNLYKNGSAVALDVPAQLINDHTMIPVRAVAEAFGAKVDWNGDSQTVTITE